MKATCQAIPTYFLTEKCLANVANDVLFNGADIGTFYCALRRYLLSKGSEFYTHTKHTCPTTLSLVRAVFFRANHRGNAPIPHLSSLRRQSHNIALEITMLRLQLRIRCHFVGIRRHIHYTNRIQQRIPIEYRR